MSVTLGISANNRLIFYIDKAAKTENPIRRRVFESLKNSNLISGKIKIFKFQPIPCLHFSK